MEKLRLPGIDLPKITLPSARLAGSAVADKDYIKDGLVFWLDGIDRGGEEGIWTDRVGWVGFRATSDTVEFGVDFVQGLLLSDMAVNYPYRESTIEAVYRISETTSSNIIYFLGGVNGSIASGVALGNLIIGEGLNNKLTYYDAGLKSIGAHTVSANSSLMMHNLAVNIVQEAKDYWSHRGDSARAGSTHIALCSIRIYDRLLSEEEMRHNQEVDKRRFNLNFPEPVMTLELDEDDYTELSGTGVSEDYNA